MLLEAAEERQDRKRHLYLLKYEVGEDGCVGLGECREIVLLCGNNVRQLSELNGVRSLEEKLTK